jgi:hypothetical protein
LNILPIDAVLVLNYNGWDGYLIKDVVDENLVFPALEVNKSLLEKHYNKFEAVLFNVNLSYFGAVTFGNELKIKDFINSDKVVLNEGLYDIRKRNLHKLLDKSGLTSAKAHSDGDPDELLMVKTNLNWGGEKEFIASSSVQDSINFKATKQHLQGHRSYYVKKRKDINPFLWNDNSIVIENIFRIRMTTFYDCIVVENLMY